MEHMKILLKNALITHTSGWYKMHMRAVLRCDHDKPLHDPCETCHL